MASHSLTFSDSGLDPDGAEQAKSADQLVDAESLVRLYWDAVYRLAYRLSGSSHTAEDLTQETFLRVIGRLKTLAGGANTRAWLMRVLTNLFLDGKRRSRSVQFQTLAEEPAAEQAGAPGAETAELRGALAGAIAQLPDHARAVLALRIEENLSFREIGQLLSITEDTARWHMLQARRQLMAKLEGKL